MEEGDERRMPPGDWGKKEVFFFFFFLFIILSRSNSLSLLNPFRDSLSHILFLLPFSSTKSLAFQQFDGWRGSGEMSPLLKWDPLSLSSTHSVPSLLHLSEKREHSFSAPLFEAWKGLHSTIVSIREYSGHQIACGLFGEGAFPAYLSLAFPCSWRKEGF